MKMIRQGTVHGNMIQITEELGLRDGQMVEVQVRVIDNSSTLTGEGWRRCAGRLANEWTPEDDQILEALRNERHQDQRRELSE